jgi:hypothetical protein
VDGPASGQNAVFGFARVDRAAPAVTRPSLSGQSRIGLPSLAGEPIVINFWSSSCVVAARYRLPGLPVTFFLAPSGRRILGVNVGALSVKSLTGILRELYGRAA